VAVLSLDGFAQTFIAGVVGGGFKLCPLFSRESAATDAGLTDAAAITDVAVARVGSHRPD
jgi:hypothetical protein